MKKIVKSLGLMSLVLAMLIFGFSANLANAATPVLTSFTVTPVVATGNTLQLNVAPLDQNNLPFVGATNTFASDNTAIATVNSTTGLVTGVSAGTATIAITSVSGSTTVTGTVAVAISSPSTTPILTTVTVTPTAPSIIIGGTTQFTAAPMDQNNTAFSGATTTFTSSDPTIATVDSTTGLATGVAAGTATITATSVSGSTTVTGTAMLTVGTTTTPISGNVATDSATSITSTGATLNGTNGNTLASDTSFWVGTTSAGPFTSSANPVPPTGWTGVDSLTQIANAPFSYSYTGLTPNTTYYFVAWSDVGGTWYPGTVMNFITASTTTTTTTPVLTSVALTAPNYSVAVGGTLQLMATPKDQDDSLFTGATTTFTSSDPTIATVDSTTGLATGVAAGTATITATSVSGSTTVTDTAIITIGTSTSGNGSGSGSGQSNNNWWNNRNNNRAGDKNNHQINNSNWNWNNKNQANNNSNWNTNNKNR
jgi:uncharacterized protein YjdB